MAIAIIIILLSMAMVIGPILWIRPSPRQQQQVRLRQRAAELGMQVRIQPRSSVSGDASDRELVVFYQMPCAGKDVNNTLQRWGLYRRNLAHPIHFYEQWDWQGAPAPARLHSVLRSVIDELPNDVFALQGTEYGVAAVWNERGADDAVNQIAQGLAKLIQVWASTEF